MKSVAAVLATLALAGCAPFDDQRDASKEEVLSILTSCHAKADRWDRQDKSSQRWMITFAPQGGDSAKRLACIENQEDELGAGFTSIGRP
jgi:hypothetical protein